MQHGTRTAQGGTPFGNAGQTAEEVDAGGFAEGGSTTGKLGIRHAHGCTRPRLGGDGAESGHDAVVDVAHGDAVAGVVVPNGEHAAENGGIALFELLIADLRRCPFLIEHRAVEVIVVVTGGGNDVNIAVGNGDELIALGFHLRGVGISVVPRFENHVLALDGRLTVCMRERTPSHGLFAVAFDVANEVVGERTEEFDHGFVLVAVFVCSDMHARADKYGIGAGTILREEAVEEGNDGGIAKIEVIGAKFFRAE